MEQLKQGQTVELGVCFYEGDARVWDTSYITLPEAMTTAELEEKALDLLLAQNDWRNVAIAKVWIYNLNPDGDEDYPIVEHKNRQTGQETPPVDTSAWEALQRDLTEDQRRWDARRG